MTSARTAARPHLLGSSLSLQHWLALAAVAALPFTAALTVDLKFPLKIYEVVLAAAALAVLVAGRLRAAAGAWRAIAPLIWFLAWAGGVLAYRVARPLDTVSTTGFETRFGAVGDGVTKAVYVGLALFGFAVFSHAAYRDERGFARVWVAGALVASAYAWYLFATSALGELPVILPGVERVQTINVGGVVYIRSGTFAEGNYLGLFLVCSTAVAAHARLRAAAIALTASVLITFSTVSLVGLAVLWTGIAWSWVRRQQGAAYRGAALVGALCFGVVLAIALVATGYADEVLVQKVASPESFSKLDRLETAVAGLRMFAEQPVGGVGIGQYAYNYKAYQLTDLFERFRAGRSIANNVYVELLAETGVVGTLLFALFVWRIFRAARHATGGPLHWGLAATLIGLNAFPSYTMMFLWAFWALVLAAGARAATHPPRDGAPARAAP